MEDLVCNGVDQIVRVGSQSKSEVLQDCTLRALTNDINFTRTEKQEHWILKSSLEQDETNMLRAIRNYSLTERLESLQAYLEINHYGHSMTLFGRIEDEEGFEEVVYHENNRLDRWLQGGRSQGLVRPLHALFESPLASMNHAERQQLYGHWLTQTEMTARADICTAVAEYKEHKILFDQVRANVDLRCLQQAKVIGITTTGLAKTLPLLTKLNSKILVCEEAGEVLEAHVLTALLPSLEHAILIGDHRQLPRKSPT